MAVGRLRHPLMLAVALAVMPVKANAQNSNMAGGHVFAREACKACHMVELEQLSQRRLVIAGFPRDYERPRDHCDGTPRVSRDDPSENAEHDSHARRDGRCDRLHTESTRSSLTRGASVRGRAITLFDGGRHAKTQPPTTAATPIFLRLQPGPRCRLAHLSAGAILPQRIAIEPSSSYWRTSSSFQRHSAVFRHRREVGMGIARIIGNGLTGSTYEVRAGSALHNLRTKLFKNSGVLRRPSGCSADRLDSRQMRRCDLRCRFNRPG